MDVPGAWKLYERGGSNLLIDEPACEGHRELVKTNAARLLDREGIAYQLRDYEIDLNDLSAIKVASQIGLPAGQVFKTLVGKGDLTGIVMAVVPGNRKIDLKALARLAGNRTVELVATSQLQHLTGYVRGGVTALACKKDYPVYLDDSARELGAISVSSGVRGTQILIAPHDFVRVTRATFGSISRRPSSPDL